MEIVLKSRLSFQEGGSDKVYNVDIVKNTTGYDVQFAYGRRGSSLATGRKNTATLTYEKAEKLFNKLVEEKVKKGYRESDSKSTISTIVEAKDSGWKPQLLNEIDEEEVEKYLDDPNFCAQEKFDGVNRGIIRSLNGVIGTNKQGLITSLTEDIEHAVMSLPEKSFIINGEAFSDYIMVFDKIDYVSDYKTRYKKLSELVRSNNNNQLKLVYTAWDYQQKRELYEKLKKENREGIVFKNIFSYYKPGRPASKGDMIKFKFRATCTCVVDAIHATKRSVSLKMFDTDMYEIPVGNVTIYPNFAIPSKGSFVEIRYLYAYKGGSLFQPVYLGERTDCITSDCMTKQLKYKKEDDE